ncbi:sensor histidine kinase [Chitinimonas naiadis]
MSVWRWPDRASLAARLVALFTLGTVILMSGVGYWLYHALKMQLDERNLAEMRGKTEVIQHLLAEIPSSADLGPQLTRFRDISVGHPHITTGIASDGDWLLRPKGVVRTAIEAQGGLPADRVTALTLDGAQWWISRIPHHWPQAGSPSIDVYLAVDISESQTILHEHGITALLAVMLGSLASGLWAFFVARRGLAPLHAIAAEAERMTSERLGTAIDILHAPGEIRGLVASLNRMLERLAESFRSLEQFSADIAHELRTPLNNLMLQTQVTLGRPRDTAEYQETLLRNLEELERLQRMVSDMLFLARADRGMLSLNREPVDLRAESDSLAEFFEIAASERQQQIVVQGDGSVQGDRLMVRRAITNLLSNAVRYAPAAACIALRIEAGPGGVTLSVSNPGEPIAADTLTRLFTRFARQEAKGSRDTDGIGLGLAIVDSIMRLHGGRLDALSQDGQIHFMLHFTGAAARQPV